MAYGFGGGLGAGFTSGVNAGTNMSEARTRRDAIMREQLDTRIAQAQELVQGGLTNLAETVAQIGQRDERVDNMIQSNAGMFMQTARMLQNLPGGEQVGKYLEQQITATLPTIKTRAEIATAKAQGVVENYTAAQQVAAGATGQPQVQQPQAGGLPPMQNAPSNPATAQPVQYGAPDPSNPAGAPPGSPAAPPGVPPAAVPTQMQPPGADPRLQNAIMEGMGFPQTAYQKTLEEEQAKYLAGDAQEEATGAKKLIDASAEAERLLNEGMITGPGADWRVEAIKWGRMLGMTDEETYQKAQNSESFVATMAGPVAQIIKQFGAGTGLSDADREFARQAVGGNITLSEGAIRDIIAINRIAARNRIIGYNQKVPAHMQVPVPPEIANMPVEFTPQSEQLKALYKKYEHNGFKTKEGLEQAKAIRAGQPVAVAAPKIQPNEAAIQYLREHPDSADFFESTFGMPAKQFLGQ